MELSEKLSVNTLSSSYGIQCGEQYAQFQFTTPIILPNFNCHAISQQSSKSSLHGTYDSIMRERGFHLILIPQLTLADLSVLMHQKSLNKSYFSSKMCPGAIDSLAVLKQLNFINTSTYTTARRQKTMLASTYTTVWPY